MYRRFLICFFLFVVPSSLLSGQNGSEAAAPHTRPSDPSSAPPAQPPVGNDRPGNDRLGNDRLLRLDVQVTDRSGVPIRGLKQADFTVLDDKQPLNVGSFRALGGEAAPSAEVFLVIDFINARFELIASARKNIRAFLLANSGKLTQPVSLIFVSSQGTKIQNAPTLDGNALAVLYDQYASALQATNLSGSFFNAQDRFNLSMKAVDTTAKYESNRAGRKLTIWIGPGWPFFSGGNIEFGPKDWQEIFKTIVELSDGLRHARTTLYSIDPTGVANAGQTQVTYYQQFLKAATSASHAQVGDLALQVLAVQSGGLVLNATNDLTAAIARCVAEADAFYTFTFHTGPGRQLNEYHPLTVTVDKPDAVVRTRAGYYAQP